MTTAPRRAARGQALPPEIQSFVKMLHDLDRQAFYNYARDLYLQGWPLRAIAEPVNPLASRSTVKSWVNKADPTTPPEPETVRPTLVTPEVPTPSAKSLSPGILPAEAQRIKELAPIARLFRASMHPKHAAAQANRELTDLTMRLHETGVTIPELAAAAGVTYRAMARRLGKANPQ